MVLKHIFIISIDMAKVISRLIIGHKDIIVLTIWVVVKLNCGLMVYCFSDDIGHNYTFS